MAVVFDVVCVIDPSVVTSSRKGRHLVYVFAPYTVCESFALHAAPLSYDMVRSSRSPEQAEREANEFAQTCRNCCRVEGITYTVEAHDELSPSRAHYESDCKASAGCFCAGAKWED